MKTLRPLMYSVCIASVLYLAGCSKNEPPANPKTAAQPPAKALINVLYDAVNSYASGAKTFQPPPGIKIEKSLITQKEGNRQIEYLQVGGIQQKEASLAVIRFTLPSSWLSSDKNKLRELESEIASLNACAQKLRTKERENKEQANDAKDTCTSVEITANGKPGIAILDKNVSHIEMMLYSLKP